MNVLQKMFLKSMLVGAATLMLAPIANAAEVSFSYERGLAHLSYSLNGSKNTESREGVAYSLGVKTPFADSWDVRTNLTYAESLATGPKRFHSGSASALVLRDLFGGLYVGFGPKITSYHDRRVEGNLYSAVAALGGTIYTYSGWKAFVDFSYQHSLAASHVASRTSGLEVRDLKHHGFASSLGVAYDFGQ